MKRSTIYALILCAVVAAACGTDDAGAAPADSQQYSSSAANAEAANAVANALTLPNRLVRDGKFITADSDGAGSSPINPGLKTLWDMVRGLRCAIWGNCPGVNMRTFKSLHVDGTGGVITTAAPVGTVKVDAAYGGVTLPTTTNAQGILTGDSGAFGFGNFFWNGATWSFTGGFNVHSITVISTGVIDITFGTAPANYLKCAGSANSTFNGGAPYWIEVTPNGVASSRLVVRYTMKDVTNTVANTSFTTLIFCGAGA
jgi:hypothetical protein